MADKSALSEADLKISVGVANPRERLLLAGEQLFAKYGWASVSVRSITAAAGVNVASLHYHFGSKEKLLEAIFTLRARPIVEERLRMLNLSAPGPGRPPLLEQILEAFLRPAFMVGLEGGEAGRNFVRLRAHVATEPEGAGRNILQAAFNDSSRQFLHAFQEALPELRPEDVYWRMHFLLGVMVYTMSDNGRIQALTDGACDPSEVERALRYMIPFLAAGFRSESITPAE